MVPTFACTIIPTSLLAQPWQSCTVRAHADCEKPESLTTCLTLFVVASCWSTLNGECLCAVSAPQWVCSKPYLQATDWFPDHDSDQKVQEAAVKTLLEVWILLAETRWGNSAASCEEFSVSAQYSLRLFLFHTPRSLATERQTATGRPAFPYSCPTPFWHPAPQSQYEN